MKQPSNTKASGLSRRKFISGAATAVTGFTIIPRQFLGGPGFVPPSEKVNIAIIGCGVQGRTNVRALFQEADAQIIAVADPIESQNLDAFYHKGAAGRLPVKAEIGDFFCPNFDPAMWALNLREPLSIEASAVGAVDKYMAPPAGIYTYQFSPRGDKPAVKFTWYEGGLRPPRPEAMEGNEQVDGNGILFIGDRGALSSPGWGGRLKLLPASRDKDYQRPKPTLARPKGHHREWLDACKGGPPASSNFGYGAALTEVGLLRLVAIRVDKRLSWDAKAMKCSNAPEADPYLKESYRAGWELPA